MRTTEPWVVVGLDNGGTKNNATVLDSGRRFLVDRMHETPSRVLEGPDVAVEALGQSLHRVLELTGTSFGNIRAVGLGTPGPASAQGVMSSKGATNFSQPAWHGFDFRGALEKHLGLPVVYINDGNAAALYAHHMRFQDQASQRSSVSAVVGTGLGGGVIESGRVVRGAAGMAGELGHVEIRLEGLLGEGQPAPVCNCGQTGDVESIASLTGIQRNLLPFWRSVYPNHELAARPILQAARAVRAFGEKGDEMALKIFEQQTMALGRLFTIVSNVLDPDAYFIGGGVVETAPAFGSWFLNNVRQNTRLRKEQEGAIFDIVPDGDMAGARGAALAALESIHPE